MDRSVLSVCAPLLVVALVTGSAAVAQSAGRSVQIGLSGAEHTYQCAGQGVDSVQVTGSGDILTITGHCGSLQVTGSGNRITIDSVESVQFTGDSNSVSYQHGALPSLSDQGQNNVLARAAVQRARSQAAAPGGSPESGAASGASQSHEARITTRSGNVVAANGEAQITTPSGNGVNGYTVVATDENGTTTTVSGGVGATVASALQAADAARASAGVAGGTVQATQTTGLAVNLALSHQRTTRDCGDGKDVNIAGDQNDIRLTGSCGTVSLLGSGNTVHVTEVGSIGVVGHTNRLTWERARYAGQPPVQIGGGTDNVVVQADSGHP